MVTPTQPPPPLQPIYILRGHASQIHATLFIRNNSRLITADADGWIIVWAVETRRPVAVWKGHDGAVLKVAEWPVGFGSTGGRRAGWVVTHGRDNKIFVWNLPRDDQEVNKLDTTLPVDYPGGGGLKPWLVASLDVNALNFCAFGMCLEEGQDKGEEEEEEEGERGLFVAVPSALSSDAVDIMKLPDAGKRIYAAIGTTAVKTGMAMSLSLLYINKTLTLIAGYESGHAIVYRPTNPNPSSPIPPDTKWKTIYINKSHSQPILSLCVSPNQSYFLTTSADSKIVKHPFGELFSPSPTSFSREGGNEGKEESPIKILDTKHSGQQGLDIRSDGKIFATAGWDGKFRVYSAKSMKELAVLKWHREGCYAVGFGKILDGEREKKAENEGEAEGGGGSGMEVASATAAVSVEERRREKVRGTHWVVGGAKDGKVSLWEVY